MKRCPFCAEEIQDEAVKCRYCQSALTASGTMPAPRPATRPPLAPEQTVVTVRMHWAVFRRPFLWLLLAGGGGWGAVAFAVWFAVMDGIVRYARWSNTSYVLTTRRLIMTTGVFRKRSLEMPLEQVESIAVSESYVGKKQGYGTVVVSGTGGTKETFPLVPQPQKFRTQVQEQLGARAQAVTGP